MKNSEEKENIISTMINISTRVVTIIFIIATLVSYLTGDKNQHWSFADIWGVLFIGIFSGLLFGLYYSFKKTASLRYNLLLVFYFLIINVLVLALGFKLHWFSTEVKSILLMEGMILIVFFLVYVLVYVFDFNQTKKINQKLQDRKNNKSEE